MDASGNITTCAGNGTYAPLGRRPARPPARRSARLRHGGRRFGNLYIADLQQCHPKGGHLGNHSTVAGTGSSGYSAMAGRHQRQIVHPLGVAVDASGQPVHRDSDNYRVRMVSTSGIITTVAGRGNAVIAAMAGRPPAPKSSLQRRGSGQCGKFVHCRLDERSNPDGIQQWHHLDGRGNGAIGFSGDGGRRPDPMWTHPPGVARTPRGTRISRTRATPEFDWFRGGIMNTLVGGATGNGGLGVFGSFNQPFGRRQG